MASLARRNLFHDKVRLAVALTGVVFAVVLITVQLGLFVGFATTTSNIIDNSVTETILVLISSATAFFLAGKGRTPLPGAVAQTSPREGMFVAAPGRVEPVSEEVSVSSEICGRLGEVFVEEDDGA
jgi:multidrug efflux pump subunit AcrA (membrane-fusion protein)